MLVDDSFSVQLGLDAQNLGLGLPGVLHVNVGHSKFGYRTF